MIKEESLKMAKLNDGEEVVTSLSFACGTVFLGTRTRPKRLQARHRAAITLQGYKKL